MEMDLQNAALALAGLIGAGVALLHGFVAQKHIVRPILALAAAPGGPRKQARAFLPGLLHFTTFNWFVGGLALMFLASGVASGARLATGLLVGSSYLYGAVVNFHCTKGRHPGWMLYALALLLVGFALWE
jgi:hypothetical protein